ncbi:MAG: glucosyl-3-phosphoglycerate synthase [Patulibacter sp.]|nr:glucosyl-3-phosphoglycerate synthase [Patulibacter sp.]
MSVLTFDATRRTAPHRTRRPVTVVVPTVDEAATIGPICRALVALRAEGVCDRVLVVDESSDETARIARSAGAEVLRQSSIVPGAGAVRGKGDAMWRAVHACDDGIVAFVDGDTVDFDPLVVRRLVAAATSGRADFVKATYRRPWDDGRTRRPTGGGRVTELAAKPLLRQLFPELASFGQPLAGEIAGTTDLLRSLPFVTGYGVDVALLIDAWRTVGSSRLAEVSAPPRQNRHRPLEELAGMADEVVGTILARAGIGAVGGPIERPPLGPLSPHPELAA